MNVKVKHIIMWNKLSISVYEKACLWLCCILFVSFQFTERVHFDHKKMWQIVAVQQRTDKVYDQSRLEKVYISSCNVSFLLILYLKNFWWQIILTSKWCKSLIAKGCQAPIGTKLEKANWLNKQISWLWRKGSSRKT